jgi:hypothetical protein
LTNIGLFVYDAEDKLMICKPEFFPIQNLVMSCSEKKEKLFGVKNVTGSMFGSDPQAIWRAELTDDFEEWKRQTDKLVRLRQADEKQKNKNTQPQLRKTIF